jgi:hypothetical protein
MKALFAVASLLLAQSASAAPGPAGPWVLSCDMGAAAPRVFRIGPKLFQEWKPERRAFGSNLCLAFACHADRGTLEGVISSSTLILTISLDPATRQATWKTAGASGLSRTNGPCTISAEKPPSGA